MPTYKATVAGGQAVKRGDIGTIAPVVLELAQRGYTLWVSEPTDRSGAKARISMLGDHPIVVYDRGHNGPVQEPSFVQALRNFITHTQP